MNILSVGGSDPSSGAGIQSDIRTFSDFGAYGFTVITALTSQNTKQVSNIEPVSKKSLKSQLDSILSDFHIDAIKIGMVYNSDIIKVIHSKFRHSQIPIIVDPIIKSTTGATLLKKNSIIDYKKMIIPLADIITPNKYEAKILSGMSNVRNAAKKIQTLGAASVIVTGASKSKNKISDHILEKNKEYQITGKIIPIENHGSGCNYSASLTVLLAKQYTISQAVKIAKNYVYNSIKNSKNVGKGVRIAYHTTSDKKMELIESINDFKRIRNIYKIIPECQTNFVFSKRKPKTIKDVLGVSGRLVKSDKEVITAGEIMYGGSHHVATAVIQVNKKFPNICSGLNIKFDPKIISKAKSCGLTILNYDRSEEPKKSKQYEGSSIKWGINNAIKTKIPDIIYHKGDMGKEPMILVFGERPSDIITKISKIT
ncbi:MAG: bifunctional hydroxymethylpyrimidine kinase/phosphomethylpyrimidine kinase [Candidatus Nitrosopelagicus sp.]|jgi:hydroxymethylpyrimidine/phosphomethylpyrimidine kinase|nr:bifunctional hydroxymethylpyrimidine kinase/phosphomethylpyrimidine kinase [Candidatus Nitrosopelagicus sp.]